MQDKKESLLKDIPKEGFIKLSTAQPEGLSGSDKAALIRKGNTLFNSGEVEKAKRIFLTTGYTDGLIRIGDWYLREDNPLEALRMYWIAPAPDKVEKWAAKAAGAVRKMLGNDQKVGKV
jgi:hypothetical protein